MADRALQTPEVVGDSVFHCQQALEKALKGFLSWHDHDFPRTHDLLRLVEDCESIDDEFQQLRRSAQLLNPFASATRYPQYGALPTIDDARSMITVTHAAVSFVHSRLPDSVQP